MEESGWRYVTRWHSRGARWYFQNFLSQCPVSNIMSIAIFKPGLINESHNLFSPFNVSIHLLSPLWGTRPLKSEMFNFWGKPFRNGRKYFSHIYFFTALQLLFVWKVILPIYNITGKLERMSTDLLGNSIQSNYPSTAWHSDSHVLMIIPQWNIDLSGIRNATAWQFNMAKFKSFPCLQSSPRSCVARRAVSSEPGKAPRANKEHEHLNTWIIYRSYSVLSFFSFYMELLIHKQWRKESLKCHTADVPPMYMTFVQYMHLMHINCIMHCMNVDSSQVQLEFIWQVVNVRVNNVLIMHGLNINAVLAASSWMHTMSLVGPVLHALASCYVVFMFCNVCLHSLFLHILPGEHI